jgi:hypothetical protein
MDKLKAQTPDLAVGNSAALLVMFPNAIMGTVLGRVGFGAFLIGEPVTI